VDWATFWVIFSQTHPVTLLVINGLKQRLVASSVALRPIYIENEFIQIGIERRFLYNFYNFI
jgi:hypothetical protein